MTVTSTLSLDAQKALILALAKGRAFTAPVKQQIQDSNGAPDHRRPQDRFVQQSRAVRDGFYMSEANDLLDWAESMEEDGEHPVVRMIIEGTLLVVGMKDIQSEDGHVEEVVPVLRLASDLTPFVVDPRS